MAATPEQFLNEASGMLKSLYLHHRKSRADYKEAVTNLAQKKMPHGTEEDRSKFVAFALHVYDAMRRFGFEPETKITDVGEELSKTIN